MFVCKWFQSEPVEPVKILLFGKELNSSENSVKQGENVVLSDFPPFFVVFIIFFPGDHKNVKFGTWLTLHHTLTNFDILLEKNPFKNSVGKGENASNQHFLLSPQCFLLYLVQIPQLEPPLICCLQIL